MRPSTRLEYKPKSFAIFVQFISSPILIHWRHNLQLPPVTHKNKGRPEKGMGIAGNILVRGLVFKMLIVD